MNSSSSKVPLKQKKAKSPITPPKEPTPRQEAVKTSLYKKKEWDDQVFGIMQEFLFEGSIGPEKLKELVAKYLEPRHYEAVIEERIAISLCGYPVCDKELKEIPGQYRISLTQKKVFDITHLKKFCSRECWAASTYLQRQIPIDPGFMRQPDSILETLEVLDIETLTSIRTTIDGARNTTLTKPIKDALIASHIKDLLSQAPKAPSLPPTRVPEAVLIDPNALVIKEHANPIPPTLNFESISIEDAEMVEGFRVSRRGRAVTDLLLEYEEKRKSEAADNDTVSEKKETNVDETMDDLRLNDAESDMETKSQRSILTLPEDAHSASGDTSSVKNLEWLEEVPKYVKPHKQRLSVSKKSSKKKSESLKSTSKPASKSKSLRPLDSADGDDVYDDDDEEPSAQWPLPSTKTVSKLSDPSYLSLFGRMWNHMSLMVTSETTKYIKTGAASVNMDSFHQVLYKEGNVDMDALGLRSRIFSEKLLKCVHGICNRYGIEWGAVREDLLAFLETLFVREAGGVVLGVVEERILGIAFLKVIANEKGEPFTSDVSLRLMTNDVVCAETGGTMDAAEIGALVRGVFYI